MHKNKIVIILVFSIISFFVFRHGVFAGVSMVEAVSSSVLYPLLRVQQLIVEPIAQWFDRRATMSDLESKIGQLHQKCEKLLAENISLKAINMYAQETSELRNFNKQYALKGGYMVQVLARHFSPSNQFFLVNAGSRQGIKKDMVALYCNGIVGKVSHVYPWYCKVSLITDADCKIASSIGSCSGKKDPLAKMGVSGIHEGVNDATYTTMRYVSHLESVSVGDTVLSSGEGLVFPKGFALGTIVAAEKGELFYSITIQPVLDLQTLRYCTLIAKEDIQ